MRKFSKLCMSTLVIFLSIFLSNFLMFAHFKLPVYICMHFSIKRNTKETILLIETLDTMIHLKNN